MANGLPFRKDIQGLRAIAVLAVMLFHYNRQWLPGGFIGVDIFFVISGFLITSILLRASSDSSFSLVNSLKQFYISRIRRIAPAYYLLLVCVTIISVIIFIPNDFVFFKNSLNSALYFNSNYYFADFGDYFAPKSDELPLLHTWSLAIEMQFYLFYPFLIFLLKEKWLRRILPVLIVVLFGLSACFLSEGSGQRAYYGLYARIPEFLVGGSVALFATQFNKTQFRLLPATGLALIILSFLFINDKTPFPGLYAVPSVVGTALLLSSTSKQVSTWLSLPILVWIGAISYSLYLWHWPILAFMRYLSSSYQLTWEQAIIYWGGSFILAYASYYWVEQWFRRRKVESPSGKVAWFGLCLGVTLISLFSQRMNQVVVPSLPVELTRYADPATICHGKIVGDCIRGDRNSKEKPILVLGDSHAAMLNHFFDVVGNELQLSFRVITASSCLPIEGFNYKKLTDRAQERCMNQIDFAKKYIELSDKITLAGYWAHHAKDATFFNGIEQWLVQISQTNKLLYILSDVPSVRGYSPVRVHRFSYLGLPVQSARIDSKAELADLKINGLTQDYSNVFYVNLNNISFFEDSEGTRLVLKYFDTHHLNELSAKLYGKQSVIILKQYWD